MECKQGIVIQGPTEYYKELADYYQQFDYVVWSTWEGEPQKNINYIESKNIEVIDIIESFDLDFFAGNVIKYVLRAGKKENEIEDLEKAKWYIERKISQLKKQNEEKEDSS